MLAPVGRSRAGVHRWSACYWLDQPMPGGSCGPAAIDNKARNDDESNICRGILQLI
jgi:hypothetical protein